MRIQWKRKGDSKKPSRDLDCTVDYSIGYTGSDPWYEGGVQLPDKICRERLSIRIHIHSSFEDLDFHEEVDGHDLKQGLKREMKDGVDHCGTCPCGDCHYDCSSVGELTSGNANHRRRRGGPPPVPSSCTCHGESPIGTMTRRRQFQSAGFKPSILV